MWPLLQNQNFDCLLPLREAYSVGCEECLLHSGWNANVQPLNSAAKGYSLSMGGMMPPSTHDCTPSEAREGALTTAS